MRSVRLASLAVIEPGTGWPLVSRVTVASAMECSPIFLISRLSVHYGALETDARASLLYGTLGRGDPLAHPRMTLIGRASIAGGDERESIRSRFLARHPKSKLYADFGDFAFWRLTPERALLNGGFGKAYELAASDLLAAVPEGLPVSEAEAVNHMNRDHADVVNLFAQRFAGLKQGHWTLACLDSEGFDLTQRDQVARVWFDTPLCSSDEVGERLLALAQQARKT